MDSDFVIEDLRGAEKAPADFRLTRKIPNEETYSLLFKFYKDSLTLTLIGIEIEADNKKKYNKFPDFKISELSIPKTIKGYTVSKISSQIFPKTMYDNGIGIGRLTLPDTISHIRGNAFGRCIIKELYIPASVYKIEPLAQKSMIYSIKVDKDNKRYDSRNDCNAIIDTANNELILGCINSIIPETVTKIGKEAFYQCGNGVSMKISIPQSVLSIGEGAFSSCLGLKEAVIASSEIGIKAFSECKGLEKILLYNSVTQIGEQAFSGCESLKEVVIPDSITEISKGSFEWCRGLEKIVISNSVKTIKSQAFSGCKGLKEVEIPNSVKKIEPQAFRSCSGLEKIEIPDSVISIGKSTFYGCNKVKIKTNNPSLLLGTKNDTGQKNKESEDFSGDKKDLFIKLKDLKDADALEYILHETLESIYRNLYNHLEPKIPHKINELFIQSIDGSEVFSYSEFVKYIRLFGMSSDQDAGNIDLYIDTDSRIVTSDKNRLVIDESIIYLEDNYEINLMKLFPDVEMVEYSISPESRVLNDEYQSVVTLNKLGCCIGSTYLNRICNIKHYDIENFFRGHEKIFHRLSPYRGGTISNYFFLTSYCRYRQEEDYCLYACIGVDGTKVSKECLRVFVTEFKSFLDKISNLISRSLQDYKWWQQAVGGAVSKVMTRNSEHNHGSHVLAHLSNDNTYEKLCDEEIKRTLSSYISNNKVFNSCKNQQLPLFIRYLKNRGCYQSEAVFGVSNILINKRLYGDVFKDFDQERILLNYISGVSGFSYKFKLLINGNELHGNNDIAVAMPGDVIGCQAFYVIIENIIRNTAKHATKQPGQVVTFTIDFRTYNNSLIDCLDKELSSLKKVATDEYDKWGYGEACDKWNNMSIELMKDPSFSKINDYYCVVITNGIQVDGIDELVRKQNELINDSVLDKNFNLRNHSLGLIEMETSAAFLRQIDISRIDSVEYKSEEGYYFGNSHKNLTLLKAINKDGALGYRFFIQKPKEFLLVGDFGIEVFQKDAASKEGVLFISEEDFAKALSDGKSFAHPFLLYPYNVSDKTKALLSNDNDSKTLLSIRKVELTQDEINKVVDIINGKVNIIPKLKESAWEQYMQSIGVESDNIYIKEVVGRTKFRNCRQVVFANHGENFESYWSDKNKKSLPELWVDSLSSYSQGKLPLFASYSLTEDDTQKPLTKYVNTISPQLQMEIFEAYHNRVVALDERIQRFSLESFEGSIPTSILFEATNVLIPKTKLDPEQFDESMIHELENFIYNEINGAFLLVHYGILERMYKTEPAITQRLEIWAKLAKRVVVTSGRGSHSLQLPDSVCFVNLSSVLNVFTENRCKFLINYIINQSRRKNE